MSFGKFLGKLVTAPIKIVAMPVKTIVDVIEDTGNDSMVDSMTKSIEKQVKEIVD